MNIVRLLKLANDLDNAGLTKEADIVDRIVSTAQEEMDEFGDEMDFEQFDSMEGAGDEMGL